MKEQPVYFQDKKPLVALVGNPNCGKTTLFNQLTGSRQKVGNYAGVTVEKKEGRLGALRVLDLPGAYSLYPRSPDERVTHDVLYGTALDEKRPDLVLCVVDATRLRRSLRLVLAVQRLGLPCVLVLNMVDVAQKRGLRLDAATLSERLKMPVVETVGVDTQGEAALRALLLQPEAWPKASSQHVLPEHEVEHLQTVLHGHSEANQHAPDERIDKLVLHPLWGMVLLLAVLFLIFQAVFAWAEAPMGWLEAATAWAGHGVSAWLPDGLLRSFIVDGVIAGLGGVVVFLPQILILFFFILVLEESGYLPRAAFLLDRLMGSVGLSGRSFIPLLSSFACAIPGIMAARTIQNPRDRLVTILLAPMMTCSARLPVYALVIGAFIPAQKVWGWQLQGLVLFALYLAGMLGSLAVAWLLKTFTQQGQQVRSLMMELPSYHWPRPKSIALGLWQRASVFLQRVGGIIFVLTVALWFLATFPAPPAGATEPAIEYSFAGYLGQGLAYVFAPIGFNWQISIALVPGMAAREVVVGALSTVYALSGEDGLASVIQQSWSLPTAFSLLAWFVFAPQCLSTLATVRRETGSWKWALVMAGYLFALAYGAAFVAYRVALVWG